MLLQYFRFFPILFFFLVCGFFSSCTSSFYQVYSAGHSPNIINNGSTLVYADSVCSIRYNLWVKNGDIGFVIFNNTPDNMYVNLAESFFILNGYARNYYRNRVYSSSSSQVSSIGRSATFARSFVGVPYLDNTQNFTTASKANSVTFHEEKIVCIPGNSAKVFREYEVNNDYIDICELSRFPSGRQVDTVKFSKENSPLVFSNLIAYYRTKPDSLIRVHHEFFVSAIFNLTESKLFKSIYQERCGVKNTFQTKTVFRNAPPNGFYIPYLNPR